jgi:catechol 2,3-dioxygenase
MADDASRRGDLLAVHWIDQFVMAVPDLEEAQRFHGAHGSDHHRLAFASSSGCGLHHLSWDVPSIDHVGVGAAHMADNGYGRGLGFGRHVLGSNYFHYVRDPWGSYSEYSCGIDYVPAGFEWRAADNNHEDSFYLFGPTTPDDFTTNYELGTAGDPVQATSKPG